MDCAADEDEERSGGSWPRAGTEEQNRHKETTAKRDGLLRGNLMAGRLFRNFELCGHRANTARSILWKSAGASRS